MPLFFINYAFPFDLVTEIFAVVDGHTQTMPPTTSCKISGEHTVTMGTSNTCVSAPLMLRPIGLQGNIFHVGICGLNRPEFLPSLSKYPPKVGMLSLVAAQPMQKKKKKAKH